MQAVKQYDFNLKAEQKWRGFCIKVIPNKHKMKL